MIVRIINFTIQISNEMFLLNLSDFFRTLGRFGTLLLGFTMVSISIFTGAIKYGITFDNILRNLPDALPWFLLLFTLLLAWEYELLGGLVMFLLGIFGFYYIQHSAHGTSFQIYLMYGVLFLSLMFILSWSAERMYELSYA